MSPVTSNVRPQAMEAQMPLRIVYVLVLVSIGGCASNVPDLGSHIGEPRSAMAMASGVTRADGEKGLNQSRVVPLGKMSGDVEILYGDPEVAGQAFVMRIRELPGTVVPPHSHPVDE